MNNNETHMINTDSNVDTNVVPHPLWSLSLQQSSMKAVCNSQTLLLVPVTDKNHYIRPKRRIVCVFQQNADTGMINTDITNVTGYGKIDHSRQTLNLRYASSKFNSQYVNFDRVCYF